MQVLLNPRSRKQLHAVSKVQAHQRSDDIKVAEATWCCCTWRQRGLVQFDLNFRILACIYSILNIYSYMLLLRIFHHPMVAMRRFPTKVQRHVCNTSTLVVCPLLKSDVHLL